MKYVIGSGWWSTEEPFPKERKKLGDDIIRGPSFHKLWYKSVCTYTNPEKILIVDSNSPIKPPLKKSDERIEFVSLDENYGHTMISTTQFSGWLRSFLLGISYAWMCDADYFVYVEQDTLLYGEGIIEHAIAHMRHSFMFGSGVGTPQIVQISLIIVHRSGFVRFMNRMNQIRDIETKISTEMKLAIIGYDWLPWVEAYKSGNVWGRIVWEWYKRTGRLWYDVLPFGYGRARPINWHDPYFYFQHGTKEEIETYMGKSNLPMDLE
jgi:hypothetical protein